MNYLPWIAGNITSMQFALGMVIYLFVYMIKIYIALVEEFCNFQIYNKDKFCACIFMCVISPE